MSRQVYSVRALVASAMLAAACVAGVRASIVIDTVPVGNPGNAADTRYEAPGYGAVEYTYNIGKYEVTAGQYTAFLNAVAATDTYGLYNTSMWSSDYGCKIERSGSSGSYRYSVAGDWANRPVNCVSWGDSARFANWLNNNQPTGAQDALTTEHGAYTLDGAMSDTALMAVNRNSNWKWAITSEDEWYKAAYHKNDGVTDNYWDYPTSSNTAPGQDMADASGNNANYYTAPYTLPIDSPYYTTVAGEFQDSDSPYGTFDQGGNVWEWNESVLYGSSRGWRGGSFDDDGSYGIFLHASNRDVGYSPTNEYNIIGFRVSEVPEPATILMLLLASVGVVRRRRP